MDRVEPQLDSQALQFEQALLSLINEIWLDDFSAQETYQHMLAQPGWVIARCTGHPCHHAVVEILYRLHEHFSDEAIGIFAADLYFRQTPLWEYDEEDALLWGYCRPVAWQPIDPDERMRQRQPWYRRLRVLSACIVAYPPSNIHERIKAHAHNILLFINEYTKTKGGCGWNGPARVSLQDDLNLLAGLSFSASNVALSEHFYYVHTQMSHSSQWYAARVAYRPFLDLLCYLFSQQRMSYEVFRCIAMLIPSTFMNDCYDFPGEAFYQQIESYQQRIVTEIAAQLTEKNCYIITEIEKPLRGTDCLLLAASRHRVLGIGALVLPGQWWEDKKENVEQALIQLVQAEDIVPSSEVERRALVEQLQQFPASTLKVLFAIATHARHVLCEALDWQHGLPLLELVEYLTTQHFLEGTGIPASTDPQCGVLDLAAVRVVLDQTDKELANEMLSLLFQGNADVKNAAMLVHAVTGQNRSRVEQGMKRGYQAAIKAYGLLPLERGEEEVLERYRKLQRVAQVGKSYNAARRDTHMVAIQVALSNLAQVAGYADAAQLEWEMEVKTVQDAALSGRVWTVSDYTLQVIMLDGITPTICVTRGGRVLKSIPKIVRSNRAYKEAKDAVISLREHVSRLRKGLLERLLVTGNTLSPADLARLLILPTARTLLERLVLRLEDGTLGLLEADACTLRSLDNRLHRIDGPIRIAHPYHLSRAVELADWQREIMHRRIVQPVKQVFRELYLLTPAEQEARIYSNRFAGQVVDGAIAARLLTSRNWRVQRSYEACGYKIFPGGLRVVWEFFGVGHYLGEDQATTASIYFEPYPPQADLPEQKPPRILLEQIPSLIFSEIMRDADLVVSVAQRSDSVYLSQERYTRIGELVLALLKDLDLQGVSIDAHFAYVQGKLARYRIHLGSAAIHIEPGSYLCIVPGGWGQAHENLFLPFTDEGEARVSEVISKILLLLDDDQIKDESILRQIRYQP